MSYKQYLFVGICVIGLGTWINYTLAFKTSNDRSYTSTNRNGAGHGFSGGHK